MGCKHRYKDISNQKFGKLTAINFLETNKNKKAIWLCKCDCGKEIKAIASNLINGHQISCGCSRKGKSAKFASQLNKVHGDTGTKLYKIWLGMKSRCLYTKNNGYKNYGGRGIRVCDEWKNNYENFKRWAIENNYENGLSIERIDVNGNYEPNNCKWIPVKEQYQNKRNSHKITFNNETLTVSQWAKKLNIEPYIIYSRLRNGWSVEKTLSSKIKRWRKNKNV